MPADAAARPTFYFAVPGDLSAPTGGYAYARAILQRASDAGIILKLITLPSSYPNPTANDLAETERLFAKLPPTGTILIDGLAFGAMPDALVASLPQKLVALVHHPLALETGLDPSGAARLEQSERSALAHADAVIVTGAETARIVAARYDVSQDRVTIAEPGVARRERATPRLDDMPRLLSVGAISLRKGYDVLVEALTRLRLTAWTLDIVGDVERDPDTSLRLAHQIYRTRQGDRIALHGAVPDDALDLMFRTSHLFILPSRFEGYGMVITEAASYGLPIIATDTTPALKSIPADAAIMVPPDDPDALGDAVRSVIENRGKLETMRDATWTYATRLPRWETAAKTIAHVLRGVG